MNAVATGDDLSTPELAAPAGARRRRLLAAALAAVVVIVVGWFVFTTDGFATIANGKSILLAGSFVGILAIGEVLVMISGNFVSMSLGTQTAVCAMTFLWALQYGLVPAILISIALGIVASGLQGAAIGLWGVSPIILTIAAGVVMQGLAVQLSDGATIAPPLDGPSISFLVDPVFGIAAAAYAMVVVAILAELWLRRTRVGATSYLVGSNKPAARAAGLPVALTVTVVFAIAGAFAAVAGIFLGAFQEGASLSLEGTLTFDAIAAVLIGGAAVNGGRGSALATLVGTLAITALGSALLLRDYSTGEQILIKGCVLLVAVVIVHLARGRSGR